MLRFSIVNLGCKVNRVESDDVAARLLSDGFKEAALPDADMIVINTCAVTGEAEKKTRKAVRHALRGNGNARVLVTGCSAALHPEVFSGMSDRIRCVGKAKLAEEVASLARELSGEAAVDDIAGGAAPALLRVGGAFPTRVGVKVQDGCNNACTYCIVHVARGRAVSRSVDQVVAECAAYADAGVKEIVLTGINLGSFRFEDDLGHRRGLAELMELLLEATATVREGESCCRFRISSVEPRDVDDALIDVIARADGRICRHLHLPLQAGSSKVLREMARPYDAEFFVSLVGLMRSTVPSLSLSTDIIVGFPGESEEEFQETFEVASRCEFSKIHVFPYSLRDGTPAALREDQIPPQVKEERAARLRSLSNKLRAQDFARRIGTIEQVLVEQDGRGMTESYHEVPVPTGLCAGKLVPLTLRERLDE